MVMVKSLSSAIGLGVLLCAIGAPAAAQSLPPDVNPFSPDFNPLPPDFNEKIQESIDKAMEKAQEAIEKSQDKIKEKAQESQQRVQDRMAFAFQDGKPMPNVNVKIPPMPPMPPMPPVSFGGADGLYDNARNLIDRERYDLAMRSLNELLQRYDGKAQAVENRVDAALYWKAYTLGKQQNVTDALNTIADLQKRFADSRWMKDAKALEMEIRQAAGQAVSPDGQNDDELKLLALRGLMRSDPDRAVPMIEQVLAGNSSVNVKENALFVLSQSQAPQAKTIIANAAKSSTNPDLQLRAVRYLGAMGGTDNSQILDDIYRTTTDAAVKRTILQGLYSSGNADKLANIARTEKDANLRRSAIRDLGQMNSAKTSDMLRAIYVAETTPDFKKDIIGAIYQQKNAAMLVEMAKAEKDPVMKREMVSKLSTMKNKEATDYMLELLK
jgi:TolA-binding protein